MTENPVFCSCHPLRRNVPLQNPAYFKATLNEFVVQFGDLIFRTQKHCYENFIHPNLGQLLITAASVNTPRLRPICIKKVGRPPVVLGKVSPESY